MLNFIIASTPTLKEISVHFDISERTVRREIEDTNSIIKESSFFILKNTQNRYQLNSPNYQEFIAKIQADFKLHTAYRSLLILDLLINHKHQTIEDFAAYLYESKVSVLNELNQLFTVTSIRAINTFLEDEFYVRRKILMLLRVFFVSADPSQLGETNIHKLINRFVDYDTFEAFFAKVSQHFKSLNLRKNELIEISLIIAIQQKRISNRQILTVHTSDYSNQTLIKIYEELSLTDLAEQSFLAGSLHKFFTLNNLFELEIELTERTRRFVRNVDKELNTDFEFIASFLTKLNEHIIRTSKLTNLPDFSTEQFFLNFFKQNQFLYSVIVRNLEICGFEFNHSEICLILIYFTTELENQIFKLPYKIAIIDDEVLAKRAYNQNQIYKTYPNAILTFIDNLTSIVQADEFDLILASSRQINSPENLLYVDSFISEANLKTINSIFKAKYYLKEKIIEYEKFSIELSLKHLTQLSGSFNEVTKQIIGEYLQAEVNNPTYLLKKLLDKAQNGIGIPKTKIGLLHTKSTSISKPTLVLVPISKQTVKSMLQVDNLNTQSINCLILVLAPINCPAATLEFFSYFSQLLIGDQFIINLLETNDFNTFKQTLLKEKNESKPN